MSTVRPPEQVQYTPGLSGDVVAGLLNDGQADDVARAAVAEALRRGARLRFIQVVDDGLSAQAQADADQATFRAAVRALRGVRGIPCRFEVVTGDPTQTLLSLASAAVALVLGAGAGAGGSVAATCQARATCPVVTVPVPAA